MSKKRVDIIDISDDEDNAVKAVEKPTSDADDDIEVQEGRPETEQEFRRRLLEPVVSNVVDALGGFEGKTYRMGDEVNGCLKDLKRLWRKDDTDDERTVARIYWEKRLLHNDLIPILLATAGKGMVEDKRAVACSDLMTAMTWPIDMAEELKELDDELDRGADYTVLQQSHLHYKAALLKPDVMKALLSIMIPPLAKPVKERTERDKQIMTVVLNLIRNLAFIKDLPPNIYHSSDQAEFSSLQSKLIRALSETHAMELLLTIAVNDNNDPLFNQWNTLILEIFYLLYRGVKPSSLAMDQTKQTSKNLHRLLETEQKIRQDVSRKASSRHSRFGTTITVKLNPKKAAPAADGEEGSSSKKAGSSHFVLHQQQALHKDASSILDMKKKAKKKGMTVDELAREENLSVEARNILQKFAAEFVENCFNPFLSALIKDIRMERPKITEKDNLLLLYVAKWFIEFFLLSRAKEKTGSNAKAGDERWNFRLIAEITERDWIVWVLKRMRQASEDKPKQWTELQAGIECLTQLLLVIDGLCSSADTAYTETAETLQQQIIYNGEILDIAFEAMRNYKQGTQSLTYLDASVHLGYSLLKMLERWGKQSGGKDVYVRKKKKVRRRKKRAVNTEEDGIADVEEEEVEVSDNDTIQEAIFTFEAFEMRFAHAEITHTLLTYLSRYKEFTSSEQMKRVTNLLHRQAVRVKAEGLFFKVSTLSLFQRILNDQRSLPREQPYKDLVNLINFILRQFFKALSENTFLAVEAFFPKNRSQWKQYSSYQEPERKGRAQASVVETRWPPDVVVQKGFSWSEELGIAVGALLEEGHKDLVEWTIEILGLAIATWRGIIAKVDGPKKPEGEDGDDGTPEPLPLEHQPSAEAVEEMGDFPIPTLDDEKAQAATKNPHLKLLFRLCKFFVLEEDPSGDELEWYIPKTIMPAELARFETVIKQFLEQPYEPEDGKKATDFISKKRRPRRKLRSPSPLSEADADADYQGGEGGGNGEKKIRRKRKNRNKGKTKEDEDVDKSERRERKRAEKRKREQEQYKSAQFIEDSDLEDGALEAFLEHEKELRKRTEARAVNSNLGIGTMRATGTKKRRRRGEKGERATKKRKGSAEAEVVAIDADEPATVDVSDDSDKSDDNQSDAEDDLEETPAPAPPPRPRPKPRPKPARKATTPPLTHGAGSDIAVATNNAAEASGSESDTVIKRAPRRTQAIVSDDEDE
ncbi:timeless-domain-containing protein [Schizophyllum commune Loenen D]|nr:timeless-domain-containing protein [Schizophyllum commune Loenen D]